MEDELDSHASTQVWTSWKAGHFSLLVWHGDHWWMKNVTLIIMHIAGADVWPLENVKNFRVDITQCLTTIATSQ